jgi:predicted XRE-type DNA-binding protein
MADDIEIVRGSGNVFRDVGHTNADLEKLKARLGAKITGVLDERRITVRKAQSVTGTPAADFSRIRNAQLSRFTVDRLIKILYALDQSVEVQVTPRPFFRPAHAHAV